MRAKRDFSGKVVVVTGGASGLGHAYCERFAAAGSKLGILDLESESLRSVAKEMSASGVEYVAVSCDVTQQDQCYSAIEAVNDRFGGVDVLINNAGITQRSAFSETDIEVFRKVMDVNFFGSLYCAKAALTSLIERKGIIITISSAAGFAPLYGRTGYAASKHALHGLFDSLRTELFGTGVDVMIVSPGFTATGISTSALDADGKVTRHPQSILGRVSTSEEVAEAVFQGARKGKRLLVLSTMGRVTRIMNKLFPSLYERLMARSLRSELER